MDILPHHFYSRPDVLTIARELLGKIIVTHFDGQYTAARIVETEAYGGITDRAAHSYGGRRTNRTEVMFGEAGRAYVYLCYGIHQLFNVVTNVRDVPQAVLIRAAEPVAGLPVMLARTGKKVADFTLTRGPGNVSKALGIKTQHTGQPLFGEEFYIASDGYEVSDEDIMISPRIGVDYAGEDALLPYRFYLRDNRYVSGKIPRKK
jgi:DNA-3-methyladenine glycosylase